MIALTGLRRTGKTTLLLRLAAAALASGTPAPRVVYFSFDEHRTASIRDVLSAWERITRSLRGSGRLLLLLDEIQKASGWQDEVKALYDRHRNLKFVVSGSESLFIRRGSHESLAGRMLQFEVHPLSFREFLEFTGVPADPPVLHEAAHERALAAYTRSQGFPELVGEDDVSFVRQYVRESVVERIVYRDLPQLLGIGDPSALEAVLNPLMDHPGQLLQTERVGKDLGVARQTASAYLRYLEQSFLLRKLYNWSPSRRQSERKLRKYYPTIISGALAGRSDDQARGQVLEWLVVRESRAGFFWQDPYKHEVDIVLEGPIPVEVKLRRPEAKGLAAFVRKHKAKRALVVTSRGGDGLMVEGVRAKHLSAGRFLIGQDR